MLTYGMIVLGVGGWLIARTRAAQAPSLDCASTLPIYDTQLNRWIKDGGNTLRRYPVGQTYFQFWPGTTTNVRWKVPDTMYVQQTDGLWKRAIVPAGTALVGSFEIVAGDPCPAAPPPSTTTIAATTTIPATTSVPPTTTTIPPAVPVVTPDTTIYWDAGPVRPVFYELCVKPVGGYTERCMELIPVNGERLTSTQLWPVAHLLTLGENEFRVRVHGLDGTGKWIVPHVTNPQRGRVDQLLQPPSIPTNLRWTP